MQRESARMIFVITAAIIVAVFATLSLARMNDMEQKALPPGGQVKSVSVKTIDVSPEEVLAEPSSGPPLPERKPQASVVPAPERASSGVKSLATGKPVTRVVRKGE